MGIEVLEDTSIYKINGVKSVKISDISEKNIFVYKGIDYMIAEKDILTYENIINSLNFSYIFETAYIEDNYIYCRYISKGNQEPLIIVFEFNIFDKLSKVSVVQ